MSEWITRRKTLLKHLATMTAGTANGEQLVYLCGHVLHERPYTDVELPFRQESNFWYLTGVHAIPGCQFVLSMRTQQSYLFVPPISDDDAVWVGKQEDLGALKQRFAMDHVHSTTDLSSIVNQLAPSAIFTLPNVPQIKSLNVTPQWNSTDLAYALAETRIIKSPQELDTMRRANTLSSAAHTHLMRFMTAQFTAAGATATLTEQQVESEWYRQTASQRFQAYTPIVAYGRHAATLHYNRNDGPVTGRSFMLVDAGAEVDGYASDITRTVPVHGRFDTPELRGLYLTVLKAQQRVLKAVRAGVEWEAMHRLAVETIGEGLVELGVLKLEGKTVPALCWEVFVVQRFMPHGLGHLIGMDVHDVGGYPRGVERIQEPGTRYLRMRRVLKEGYVVTVEPGCYFVDALMEEALKDPRQSPHIDRQVLDRYVPLGGVRIEDCIVITKDGHENLTTAPKTIEEIEAVMTSPK